MEINLLDCTMRDGGYVNDWNFGNSIIRYMLQRYINSNIEYVEIGFLDERREFDSNRTIFPNTESVEKIYGGIDKKKTKLMAMIDYGTCNIDNLDMKSESIIDGIRIIFKKPNMYNAIDFAKKVLAKGYMVSINMVSITSYEDQDILDFCKAVNEIKPMAVAIVDTYGLMHKEQMQHYFELLDHNLAEEIAIGYHSHNNFQLAYSNSIEILNLKTQRTIILDGSAYGMGKSAGNAPIELLAMHLNDNYKKHYEVNQILEIIDTAIIPIYKRRPWGYSELFYIAALNQCHPNYINFLLDRATLSIESINQIAEKIDPDKKLNYDEEYIKKLYQEFQKVRFDDTDTINDLRKKYSGKPILLLGPGKTISSDKEKIRSYIKDNAIETIAINFIPKEINANTLFIGNAKRYSALASEIKQTNIPVIATSNVLSLESDFKYVINSETVLDNVDIISDNSFAMLLNLLLIIEPSKLILAGFDGYGYKNENDFYCVESYNLSDNLERLNLVTMELSKKLKKMKEKLCVEFITCSEYEV